jgi:pimeloyl-ACP methyl ester carboxylesterase
LAPGFEDPADLDAIRDVHELAFHYDDLLASIARRSIGHSFGAMVAAELAAHVPSRVRQLVLIAPIGLWDDRYDDVVGLIREFASPGNEAGRDGGSYESGGGSSSSTAASVRSTQRP